MKAELTDLSACRKSFEIEVPQDVVDHEITHIAQEYAKRARVPGFRPGKAPLGVVKTRFKDEILSEMVQHLLPKYFTTALKEKALDIVNPPEYDAIEFDNGKPLKFKALFEVYPELNVTNYKGIPATAAAVEVPETDIESTIKKLQDDMAELTPVEEERAIAAGDFAEISFTGTMAGEEQPLFTDKATVEVGGQTTLKEFNENLAGAAVNEEKSFDITYREDYPEKRLAGKTVAYQVKIEGLKTKKVPDLNDEFAQGVGEYKTLEELRAKVREDLEKHRKNHANDELRDQLLVWLEDNNEFEVPQTLVDRQIQVRMQRLVRDLSRQGINPERLDVDWAKIQSDQQTQAVRDVKGSLLLDFVAEQEKIETSELEVEAEIDRIAVEMNQERGKVKEVLTRDAGISRLRGQLQNKKTLDFLQEHAQIQAASANG